MENIATPNALECIDVNCRNHEHSVVRDEFMMDLLFNMVETSFNTILLTSGKSKGINNNNCLINKAIPGWKESVEQERNDSIFWHQVWIESNRPNKGVVYDIMKRTRNKYHYAVRKAKKEADNIYARVLLEAAKKGDMDLLEELKKFKNDKKSNALDQRLLKMLIIQKT